MTDAELLELAARAHGDVKRSIACNGEWVLAGNFFRAPPRWNPLKYSDDAFELMVKLGIETYTEHDDEDGHAYQYAGHGLPGERIKYAIEPHGGDAFAATRRAIVRCAAEVGKGMK